MNAIWTDIRLVSAASALAEGKARLFGPGAASIAIANPLSGIEHADAALSQSHVEWNAALFKRAERLKAVARSGIGVDNINLEDATAYGICVINAPDAPTEAAAELTIALMLAVARKLCVADRRLRREGWIDSAELAGFELAGKTLGLIGVGRIGSRVAEIGRALRMTVIGYDPSVPEEIARSRGVEPIADLRTLMARSDVVSVHIPLTPSNRGLIGKREIGWMKQGAVLINVARGPIVVETALAAALRDGHLRGAGLDVWNPEPTLAENPLFRLDNVVGVPHVGAATEEARLNGNVSVVRDVLMVLEGVQPPNLVNPDAWDRRRT